MLVERKVSVAVLLEHGGETANAVANGDVAVGLVDLNTQGLESLFEADKHRRLQFRVDVVPARQTAEIKSVMLHGMNRFGTHITSILSEYDAREMGRAKIHAPTCWSTYQLRLPHTLSVAQHISHGVRCRGDGSR